jgi:hypothetical protein
VLVIGGLAVLGRSQKQAVYADAWDARVQYAVDFIEHDKGRPFEHPVFVDFMPEAEFVASVTARTTDVTDEQRKAAADEVARLRALGLVQGDVDLLKEQTALHGSGTAAFYDPKTKHVRVRGTDLSLALKGTLVHELTHAWQDQNYDLTRLPTLPTQQAQDAFRTMAEGDAVNSENAWIDTLSAADKTLYDDQRHKESDTATSGMSSVPDVLIASFGAPYEFGPSFMAGVEADGGTQALDALWADPPTADEQIMNPWDFLDGASAPKNVPTPDTKSVEPLDEGSLGELFIYLMLAEHIDPHDALLAADGWDGDAYALLDEGGKVCVKARINAIDAGAAGKLEQAFRAWGAELPHVTVAYDDRGVDVDACDPGTAADLKVTGRSSKTIGFPAIRLSAWAAKRQSGDSEKQAVCYADAFIAELTLDDLSTKTPIADARVAEVRAAATKACPR